MGWFTGCRPVRGLLLPSALIRSAAALMSSVVVMILCSSRHPWSALRASAHRGSSPRNPRNLQSRRRDHLAHDFVEPSTERDDEGALGLAVQPFEPLCGIRIRRIAVRSADLLVETPRVLN